MKIYTKQGDTGETSLIGGSRVTKDNLRVAAYGDIDELNAVIGTAMAGNLDGEIAVILQRIQHELFDLGAELATAQDAPESTQKKTSLITEGTIKQQEEEIDRFTEELPPLKNFILPGGSPSAAGLHHARTVCRRAERTLVTLQEKETLRKGLLVYVNRLSDLLFVLARLDNQRSNTDETLWNPGNSN